MDIEQLKKAAGWMGFTWIDELHIKDEKGCWVVDGSQWRPDLETGRHFLVEIEKQLDTDQGELYVEKMEAIYENISTICFFPLWLKTAPSYWCFVKIMEVIPPK